MQNKFLPDLPALDVRGWPEQNDLRGLLEAALQQGALDEAALMRIVAAFPDLLAKRYARLRDVESTSLPRESAERLLESCLYLIGLGLQTFSADEAVTCLCTMPLDALLMKGRGALDRKIRAVGRFMPLLAASALPVNHPAYRYATTQAHRAFFSTYDADWGAHELNWTPEYLPCLPLPRVGGILYLQAYLEALHVENQILRAAPFGYLQHIMAQIEADLPVGASLAETLDPGGALADCNLCALLLDDLTEKQGRDVVWIAEHLQLRGRALREMQRYCAAKKDQKI